MLFRSFGEFKQFIFSAPFRSLGTFLVELAQIVQVIDVITNALGVGSFAARG